MRYKVGERVTAKKSGIKEFCIVIGYHGEKIREHLSRKDHPSIFFFLKCQSFR